MSRTRLAVVALAVLVVALLVVSTLIPTDTKLVRRLIDTGRRAIIHHDLNGVMLIVDRTYEDDFGFNYASLREWFRGQFRSYDSITCTIPLMSVNVYHNEAVCTLGFWFAKYQKGRKTVSAEPGFDDDCPVYQGRLVINLNKFPEGWLVTGAGE
jgi:hypothetical protein